VTRSVSHPMLKVAACLCAAHPMSQCRKSDTGDRNRVAAAT